MSLKITLTIDQESEQGTVLIGLLAKAFGRGEAGVSELRIERGAETPPELVARGEAIARMVAAREARELPKRQPYKRKGYELGMRAMKHGKPNGVTVTLHALKAEATLSRLRNMWSAQGLNPTGIGATLSKLKGRGYVKRVGDGVWRLTPKGEELEQRTNEKVEHDDSAND